MASVLTGQYGTGHGVRLPHQPLPGDRVTLAQVLQRGGYRTGAIVASFDLDHVFGLDRGFDAYDDRFDAPIMVTALERPVHIASIFFGDVDEERRLRRTKLPNDALRGDAETSAAAIAWLRRTGGRPFFLWVHYFGAHERGLPHARLAAAMAQYEPSVLRVDDEVGRLLQALTDLALTNNTLVVLHADNGQGLLDRSGFGHGTDLYEPSVRVPLLMRWPGQLQAGQRVEALARLVDIFPTVVDLVGLAVPGGLDGRSLVPLLRGTATRVADDAYLETFLSATAAVSQGIGPTDAVSDEAPEGEHRVGFVRRGIRTERWKYIRNEPSPVLDLRAAAALPADLQSLASEELYDLTADPMEHQNLATQDPGIVAQLRARLARYAHEAGGAAPLK